MAAMSHKIIVSISRGRHEHSTRHLQSDAGPPMSMLAVSLHLEAMFLKAILQQDLGRFAGIQQFTSPSHLSSICVCCFNHFEVVLHVSGVMSLFFSTK